jgi:hypothetical protein
LLQIRENEGLPSLPHRTPVLEPQCDARISVPPTPSAIARPAWPLGSAWKLARIGLAGMCEWRSTSDDVERVVVRRDYFFALRFVFLAVFFTADFVFVLAFLAFFAMLPS